LGIGRILIAPRTRAFKLPIIAVKTGRRATARGRRARHIGLLLTVVKAVVAPAAWPAALRTEVLLTIKPAEPGAIRAEAFLAFRFTSTHASGSPGFNPPETVGRAESIEAAFHWPLSLLGSEAAESPAMFEAARSERGRPASKAGAIHPAILVHAIKTGVERAEATRKSSAA
jgi:hypothetical protein